MFTKMAALDLHDALQILALARLQIMANTCILRDNGDRFSAQLFLRRASVHATHSFDLENKNDRSE